MSDTKTAAKTPLPAGLTCGDCAFLSTCISAYRVTRASTACAFTPPRFTPKRRDKK